MKEVYRISAGCTSCTDCVDVCPTQSILPGAAQYVIDTDTCHGCGICAQVCPVNVIAPFSHSLWPERVDQPIEVMDAEEED